METGTELIYNCIEKKAEAIHFCITMILLKLLLIYVTERFS